MKKDEHMFATSGAPPSVAILEAAYDQLNLRTPKLVRTSDRPSNLGDPSIWRGVGDWLLMGSRVGADRMFFVDDDPVLVFSELPSSASHEAIMEQYRRVWSMARPRCLFLAVGDELRVYGLDAPPIHSSDDQRSIEPIAVVKKAADVSSKLKDFHRSRIESGVAFERDALALGRGRADQRLLRDVQAAAEVLCGDGLPPSVAHGLIERAILIRYLEDRGVLTDDYFRAVSRSSNGQSVTEISKPDFGTTSSFIRLLGSKSDTYRLFKKLAVDFNGDLFIPEKSEERSVTANHLRSLQGMLQGSQSAMQEQLFLWAYDFGVVPTSLVSTMYELFYNSEGEADASNTHYTPPELVEFVLADLLGPSVLDRKPMVCDPACGSGIFLVEAFRRMVRHEAAKQKRSLSGSQLRTILLTRIAGSDIDESAVRLAAFSLYVAYLNYQSPQDIRSAGPLPTLIGRDGNEQNAQSPLVVADAFSTEKSDDGERDFPWPAGSFDVVVGNPPWTEPPRGIASKGEAWAKANSLPVGDRSPSQLFIWRSMDLVREDGVCGLLVSSKVLFNTRNTSKSFRNEWLSRCDLERVVNFNDVRRDFFKKAVAPFAYLRYSRQKPSASGRFVYETARKVPRGRRGAPALARLDRRVVSQDQVMSRHYLWKTFSAGDHRDAYFLQRLELFDKLSGVVSQFNPPRYGYQRGQTDQKASQSPGASWRDFRSLKTFRSFGPIRPEWLEPVPSLVKLAPPDSLFRGRRILIRRGVTAGFGPEARLESDDLAFRHTVYCIPIEHRATWEAKVILGILLSRVGRYWLYMVSGSWGTWNDEVRAEQILELPIVLDKDRPATKKIVDLVSMLDRVDEDDPTLESSKAGAPKLLGKSEILRTIDSEVEVLFELSRAEVDLVADFWAGFSPQGSTRAVEKDENIATNPCLKTYGDAFRAFWRASLNDKETLNERFFTDRNAEVLGAVFSLSQSGGRPSVNADDESDWEDALGQFSGSLDSLQAGSMLSHGMVRAVTRSSLIVVKRNESRLWSATAARADAEATISQAISLVRE